MHLPQYRCARESAVEVLGDPQNENRMSADVALESGARAEF